MAKDTAISISFKLTEDANGLKRITADAAELRKAMQGAVHVSTEFQNKFINLAAVATGLRGVADSARQLSDMLGNLTGESAEFNKAMRAANTMAGRDAAGFKQLKGDVAALAREIPIARDQLANGLYQVISNGVPEDNWIEFLNKSARSAVGGIADINKVVTVTSTLIKNYGLEWSAAGDIQDKIQLTAKNGVTSFELLAQALPRVTGNAATLGVSVDELLGTFATLTGVSGNTAEVSTQLAAVFTALVKPSSEAAEMAAKMGIEFNAAAIKGAGGFGKFLTQLDSSIKAYAQATGVLEQEVYAKLFGSAEALRALIPLQGELAGRFQANVAEMVNSAGTMDAAYGEMASTGEATAQRLQNSLGAVTDRIAGFTAPVKPFVDLGASALSAGANVVILVEGFRKLEVVQKIVALRSKAVSGLFRLIGVVSKQTRLGLEMLAVANGKAAATAAALKIALRGLLAASGVGLVIAGLSAVMERFSGSADDATSRVKQLDDAEGEYIRTAAQAKVRMEDEIKKLGALIKGKKDTTEAVAQLNERYGEMFGKQKTAADWYDTLIKKSQIYATQLGYEAQMQDLIRQQAEASLAKEVAAERMKKLKAEGKDKNLPGMVRLALAPIMPGQAIYGGTKSDDYKKVEKEYEDAVAAEKKAGEMVADLTAKMEANARMLASASASARKGSKEEVKDLKVNTLSWQQCADAIEKNDTAIKNSTDPKQIAGLRAQNMELLKRQALLGNGLSSELKKGGKGSKNKKLVVNPTTEEDYRHNKNILEKRFTGEDTPEQRQLLKDIALCEKKLQAMELLKMAAQRPQELETLEDISKELEYQNALYEQAEDAARPAIDAERKRLEMLREEKERKNYSPGPIEELKTYAQLNEAVAYYEWLVENGTEKERISARQHLNDLDKVKRKWDEVLDELSAPGDISTLDSIEKLDDAISYIDGKIQRASDDEIAALQRTKMAYEDKRKAMQRGVEIPQMVREADDIKKLQGKEYKIKIRGMGFDELTAKIEELNRLLSDMDHPLPKALRKDVESLKATYEQWRKEGVMAFDTFRNGWDGLKGMQSGVESLTGALSGNRNAWQMVTGVVDGFLQIYDGIQTVVGIMNMLNTVTQAQAAAKTVEAAASTEAAVAQGAGAVTAETAAAAQAPVAAANEVTTASYMKLAAAAYYAAHAYIPFAGFGIASGFVSAAAGVVKGIGKVVTATPFANGGVVSGPTVGLIGEYAGASNNPEVVAPLDKLRKLMTPAGAPVIVGGTLRASGRELVCVLANETRIASKSGRKTNIKI